MTPGYRHLPTLAALASGASAVGMPFGASLADGPGAGWNPDAIRTRPDATTA